MSNRKPGTLPQFSPFGLFGSTANNCLISDFSQGTQPASRFYITLSEHQQSNILIGRQEYQSSIYKGSVPLKRHIYVYIFIF